MSAISPSIEYKNKNFISWHVLVLSSLDQQYLNKSAHEVIDCKCNIIGKCKYVLAINSKSPQNEYTNKQSVLLEYQKLHRPFLLQSGRVRNLS